MRGSLDDRFHGRFQQDLAAEVHKSISRSMQVMKDLIDEIDLNLNPSAMNLVVFL